MSHHFTVDPESAGQRLDHFLQRQLPAVSRSRLQSWAKDGRVLINQQPAKPSQLLRPADVIDVHPADLPPLSATPENIPLDIIYEDPDVVVINKPAGMTVHAGAGVHHGTLVNALLHHFAQLSQVQGALRPGIVHRLDRFTSGVLIVAKTDQAHHSLAHQFAHRDIEKIYLALVQGLVKQDHGIIEKPITRDPIHRTRFTAKTGQGRAAWTEYFVERRFAQHTLLRINLGTGRTHQIRVHLSSLGHPIVGDTLYGAAAQPSLDRFLLHAHRLTFTSPTTGEPITATAPLPGSFLTFVEAIE